MTMITKQLAEEIVHQTIIRLNHNLNVMDMNGMILASGETDRIHRIHEGAAYVAKTGEELWITEHNLADWQGSKPGVNMPIRFQQKQIGVIGITGTYKELKDVASLVQLTTEMMVHQSLITSESEWKRKIKELLFDEMRNNRALQPTAYERLDLLNFSVKPPFVIILLQAEQFSPSSNRVIEQIEDLFERSSVLVGHSKLQELFIVISNAQSEYIDRKLQQLLLMLHKQTLLRIGVGNFVDRLENLAYAYETAKDALRYRKSNQQLTYYEDVELIALLHNNPSFARQQFGEKIVAPLNDTLQQSLITYFSHNQSIADASDSLGIHRHTLTNRLRKVEELTGLNPMHFQDAFKLQIALLLQKN